MKKSIIVLGLLGLIMIGCKKDSDNNDSGSPIPSPTFLDVSGTWAGSYTTNLIGPKSATFVLAQNGASVTGTVGIAEGTGNVTGVANESQVAWDLSLGVPGCTGNFSGVITRTSNRISTSFNGSDCLGTHVGSGTFIKQ